MLFDILRGEKTLFSKRAQSEQKVEQFIKVTDRQKVEIYILKVEIYTQNSDFLSFLSELIKILLVEEKNEKKL